MTTSAFAFLYGFFHQVWRFFNSWNVPGTNLTPAEALVFFVVAFFLIRLLRMLFNDANS